MAELPRGKVEDLVLLPMDDLIPPGLRLPDKGDLPLVQHQLPGPVEGGEGCLGIVDYLPGQVFVPRAQDEVEPVGVVLIEHEPNGQIAVQPEPIKPQVGLVLPGGGEGVLEEGGRRAVTLVGGEHVRHERPNELSVGQYLKLFRTYVHGSFSCR